MVLFQKRSRRIREAPTDAAPPKRRGRKPTGKDPVGSLSLPSDLADAIDAAARAAGMTGAGKIRQLVVAGFASITGQTFDIKIDKQRPRTSDRTKQQHAAPRPIVQPALFDGLEGRET